MVVSQTFQGVATIFSLSYIILNKINCENLCSLTKEPELLGIIPKLLPLTISSITIMILMLLNRPDTSRLPGRFEPTWNSCLWESGSDQPGKHGMVGGVDSLGTQQNNMVP